MPVRRGRQDPTFQWVTEYDHTDGDVAIELFESYGVRFIPAQRYEMRLYLAKNESGDCAAQTIGLSRPRQNGKSFAARYYALWNAFVDSKSVLYSAHNGGTTRKMFKFMCDFIEANDDFRKKLKAGGKGVYKAQGSEGIYLADGTCIEFSTRTNSGARGGTYDVIIVDEAQELTDEQDDALSPTTIASGSGDPQMILLGTPPNQKCPGTVFRDLHDKAHAGGLGDSWWLEWAATEIGDPSDVNRWYECNPMMGYRIKERSMRDAATKKRPDSFAREHLGWWSSETSLVERVIDMKAWKNCLTDDPPASGLQCRAVKFSPDGSGWAMAVCLKPDDGKPYIECIATGSMSHGVGRIASALISSRADIASLAVDGRVGAQALIERLIVGGFSKRAIVTPTTGEFAGAVSMLVNAVNGREVEHMGQPALDASATLTAKRRIGSDGFGFATTDEGDASLIEACALAYREAMTTKRRPGRKQVIW